MFISDTLLWIYKSLNLNIFSDLRKPGLVSGESLSLSAKIYSVKEKYPTYNNNLDCFSDSELDSESDEGEQYHYEHGYETLI